MSNDWRRHVILYAQLAVVVASISLVVCLALLIPRVQQAREDARRAAMIAAQAKERARLRVLLKDEGKARKNAAARSGLHVK